MHDITALRFAVLTATTLSFAKAAMLSGVKQATLSRRVAELERRLGLKLFERSTRGAVPTDQGRQVIHVAQRILMDLDKLQEDSRAISLGHAGSLGIGFSTSLASGNLRALTADLIVRYPELRLTGLEGDRRRLTQALQAGVIDFAVITGEMGDVSLRRRPLWSERVMVVFYEDHPLTAKDRIYWPDLRRERFVQPNWDPGPDLTSLAYARLREPGFQPEVEIHEVTRDNVANMVPIGRYLTLTTDAALGRPPANVVLREVYDLSGSVTRLDFTGYWLASNRSAVLPRLLGLIDERYPP